MATELAVDAPAPAGRRPRSFAAARLLGGFAGRAWLWFLGGCLIITLLPLLFGWRPYVVESGSMYPRLKVGDVILAAPEHNEKLLLGHVTVFHDPDPSRAGTVKSHRVVKINPDGTMVTKGDANQTVDPTPLPQSDVIGLGRLLVRWIGLPMIWLQQGAWLNLALFLGSLGIGVLLVLRDTDDDLPDPDVDGDEVSADEQDADEPAHVKARGHRQPGGLRRLAGLGTFSAVRRSPVRAQESVTVESSHLAAHARHHRPTHARPARVNYVAIGRRSLVAALGALALLVPTTQAAFSATTKDTGNTWSVPVYNYSTQLNAMAPYLYWKLDDTTATTAADSSGNGRTGTYNSTWQMSQTGALVDQSPNLAAKETNGAARGANTSCIYTSAAVAGMATPGPSNYTEIIWFKTTSTTGGKLIGLENNRTGVSNNQSSGEYDRMLYMDGNGEIWFGVWTGAATAINSVAGLNDGNWHMAAASMSSTTGMSLYIDGNLVGTNPNTTSQANTQTDFWRVGCGNLAGWGGDWTGANAPGNGAADNENYPFNGTLDEASVWLSTLTASQIAFLYFTR